MIAATAGSPRQGASPAASSVGDRRLRLVTLNLLNDPRRWPERAPLVVEGLAELAPDAIAFQEVDCTSDQAQWLAERLGGLGVALCPGTGRRSGREGLAVLSRWPIRGQERLELGRQGRVAQKVRLDHAGSRWTIVNAHLHWGPWSDGVRQAQVRRLLAWLEPDQPTVLCGDLNALPHQGSVRLLRERLVWAAPTAREPFAGGRLTPTFPTPLWRGPDLRSRLRHGALLSLGLLLQHRWQPWHGTLDYIFVDPATRVLASAVVLDRTAADGRLCASDHRGVLADIAAPVPGASSVACRPRRPGSDSG